MSMPQSMMVLSEADELRRRRNTEIAQDYDNQLVGSDEVRNRYLSNTMRSVDVQMYRSQLESTWFDTEHDTKTIPITNVVNGTNEYTSTLLAESREGTHLFLVENNDNNTQIDTIHQRDMWP